jgi:hypothetical protein
MYAADSQAFAIYKDHVLKKDISNLIASIER